MIPTSDAERELLKVASTKGEQARVDALSAWWERWVGELQAEHLAPPGMVLEEDVRILKEAMFREALATPGIVRQVAREMIRGRGRGRPWVTRFLLGARFVRAEPKS